MQGITPAQMTNSQMVAMGITCFASGTMIRTPSGSVPVEELCVGDMVETLDHGPQPIRYIARTTHNGSTLKASQVPILISAGSLGNGQPERDLVVSQQHRMLLTGWPVQAPAGDAGVLAPAKGLLGLRGVRLKRGAKRIQYVHLLFARHEIIFAENAPTESLYPGPTALNGMSVSSRRALFRAMPQLRYGVDVALGGPARQLLSIKETEKLVRTLRKARKQLGAKNTSKIMPASGDWRGHAATASAHRSVHGLH